MFYFIFSSCWSGGTVFYYPPLEQVSWLLGFFREFNRKNLINTSGALRALLWYPQGSLPCCRVALPEFRLVNPSDFSLFFFFDTWGWLRKFNRAADDYTAPHRSCVSWPVQNHVLTLFTLGLPGGFCHNFLFWWSSFHRNADWLPSRVEESCQFDRFERCVFWVRFQLTGRAGVRNVKFYIFWGGSLFKCAKFDLHWTVCEFEGYRIEGCLAAENVRRSGILITLKFNIGHG